MSYSAYANSPTVKVALGSGAGCLGTTSLAEDAYAHLGFLSAHRLANARNGLGNEMDTTLLASAGETPIAINNNTATPYTSPRLDLQADNDRFPAFRTKPSANPAMAMNHTPSN
jgi:hypothetical protein